MPKGIMIAAPHSGSGKTTVSMGLMGVLSKRYRVKPYKVGPDYIDPSYHRYITGTPSTNLDIFMLGENTLKFLYARNTDRYDISLIESVMGLYDGVGTTAYGSSAHVAKLLNLPVILVIDAGAMAASVSALVSGYVNYDKRVNIAGVIFNKVGSEKHFHLLKECVERDTGLKVLGYLPMDKAIELPSRHLGLVPASEMVGLNASFARLNELIERYIDIDGILKIAEQAGSVSYQTPEKIEPLRNKVSVAVAMDEAFNFYYSDGLELLEQLGGELVPFSPIRDDKIPDGVKGLYLGGGFPEIFAKELSENNSMKSSIKDAVREGMPVYAECGGLMYLTRSLKDLAGCTYDMVGIFEVDSEMTRRLQRFGYVQAEALRDNILMTKGEIVKGHEFHHSTLKGYNEDSACYEVSKPDKSAIWKEGLLYRNCLATYVHTHFWSNPGMAKRFLLMCEEM